MAAVSDYHDYAEELDGELKAHEDSLKANVVSMGAMRWEYAQKLRSLRDSYYQQSFKYRDAVHRNSYYQFLLSVEIEWLQNKVVAMEQYKGGFLEVRDMAKHKKELFDTLNADLETAYGEMQHVTRDELAVLRNYENPPPIVLETILTVMAVRGEPPEPESAWEQSRIILSETYYFSFFVNKCRKQTLVELAQDGQDALERFLLNPESVPETVKRASVPAGAMAKWLYYLNLFYHYSRITKVNKQLLDDVKEDLMQLRLRLQEKKAEISGAKHKLSTLEALQHEEEKQLCTTYDMTMMPVQEQFVEAHHRYNELYSSPRRRQVTDAYTTGPI